MSDDVVNPDGMPDQLRPLAERARVKIARRWAPPDIILERLENGEYRPACPYPSEADEDAWWLLLLDAFGTRTYAVAAMFLQQLQGLLPLYWTPDGLRPKGEELRAAVAIVASMKPEDEAQACLAAQAVALHFATMKVGKSLMERSLPDSRTAASLAAVAKVYGSHLETMQRLKGGKTKRQTIKVEKHVHVHHERHVHLPGEGGGDFGSQAHDIPRSRARARQSEPIDISPVRRENSGGEVVPFAPCEGEEALPASRRG